MLEKIYLLFLLAMLGFFALNLFDFGCIFAYLTWLTWPMEVTPETGSAPLKRRV